MAVKVNTVLVIFGHLVLSLKRTFIFQNCFISGCFLNVKNCADPDQTAPQEQSDLGLHCLLPVFRKKKKYSNFTNQKCRISLKQAETIIRTTFTPTLRHHAAK